MAYSSLRKISFTSDHVLVSIVVLSLFLVPGIIKNPYIWGILVMANIYAAFGISFDLLLGYTGLAVLGFGLFVGVGAYSAAFFNLYFGVPPWLTLPICGIIGAFFGILLGIPCLRLKGLYLALASFAAAAICENLVIVFHEVTNGREGLFGLDPFSYSQIANYYISLVLLLVSIWILLMIVRSKTGLILKSICDDEEAAQAVGINTSRYKLYVFVISSFLGGFWGCFFAHYMMNVGAEVFGLHMAISIFMVAIVGGMGTIIGPVGGAYLLIILNEILREVGEVRLLIYALITLVIYLLLPKGIVPPTARFCSKGLRKLFDTFHIKKGWVRHNEIS